MASPVRFKIRQAATVLCLRTAPAVDTGVAGAEITLDELRDLGWDADSTNLRKLFSANDGVISFNSRWEVLMGQSECRNHLRSTPDTVAVMRYPGEMKFPGGKKDEEDTSLRETARRELEEEFMCKVPSDAQLRLFNVKQTKPVRGVSYVMHNFIAIDTENPWLQRLHVETINQQLSMRREAFAISISTGAWWQLSMEEKMKLSPEVREVMWVSIRDAVRQAMTSKSKTLVPINAFQQAEFEQLSIRKRDPMYQTMATMLEIERYPTPDALATHCASVSEEEMREFETTRFMKAKSWLFGNDLVGWNNGTPPAPPSAL